MSRKRNPESSTISVLDKSEMIEEDEYFEGTGLETDNISNIMRTQGVSTVETSSVSTFFDHHDEDEEDQDGNDIGSSITTQDTGATVSATARDIYEYNEND